MRFAPGRRQGGVVLIALLAVISIGASWIFFSELNKNTANNLALQRAHNAKVLEEAKRALLGWAALNAANTSDVNPGRLPCPEDTAFYYDASNEGTAATACADASSRPVIGRLPWRTLGIPKLLDASGEPLWYVVSNGWKLDSTTAGSAIGINSNSAGQLTLGSQTPVALIIAPGPAIAISPIGTQTGAGLRCVARNQSRNISSPTLPDYRDYLECENASSPVDTTFITSVPDNGTNPVFNDQLVAVSSTEVMNAIEGPVAERIKNTVVPKLQETYVTNAAQWGATTTNPVFPFPARLYDTSTSTFNPDSYKGSTAAAAQGLLPISASSSACAGIMAGHCDSTFVQWSTAGITVTKNSGTGNISYSCTGAGLSSSSQITCNITIQQWCGGGLGFLLGGNCTMTFDPNVTISATAQNAGKVLRTITTSSVTNLSGATVIATLGATGNAATATTGTINATDTCGVTVILGILIPCLASTTVQVTVPIGVFQDHPLNTALSTDNWYWFTANRWYDVTYYAVAASHTPSGAHNCTSASDCITVTNGTPSSNIRAVLALAGRSLNGTSGSNRALSDFLDSTENQNGDRAFEQKTVNKSFNDRFITVSNY